MVVVTASKILAYSSDSKQEIDILVAGLQTIFNTDGTHNTSHQALTRVFSWLKVPVCSLDVHV